MATSPFNDAANPFGGPPLNLAVKLDIIPPQVAAALKIAQEASAAEKAFAQLTAKIRGRHESIPDTNLNDAFYSLRDEAAPPSERRATALRLLALTAQRQTLSLKDEESSIGAIQASQRAVASLYREAASMMQERGFTSAQSELDGAAQRLEDATPLTENDPRDLALMLHKIRLDGMGSGICFGDMGSRYKTGIAGEDDIIRNADLTNIYDIWLTLGLTSTPSPLTPEKDLTQIRANELRISRVTTALDVTNPDDAAVALGIIADKAAYGALPEPIRNLMDEAIKLPVMARRLHEAHTGISNYYFDKSLEIMSWDQPGAADAIKETAIKAVNETGTMILSANAEFAVAALADEGHRDVALGLLSLNDKLKASRLSLDERTEKFIADITPAAPPAPEIAPP